MQKWAKDLWYRTHTASTHMTGSSGVSLTQHRFYIEPKSLGTHIFIYSINACDSLERSMTSSTQDLETGHEEDHSQKLKAGIIPSSRKLPLF